MKTILSVTLMTLLGSVLQAQSLSYSDVLNIDGDCASGTHVIDTVPAGKIWKIENLSLNNVSLQYWVDGSGWLTITEGNDAYAFPTPSTSTLYAEQPLWLDEGKILRASCGATTGYRYMISIIEFQHTP